MPKCPQCDSDIDFLWYNTKGRVDFSDNAWWQTSAEKSYCCPECFQELDGEDLDGLGVPEEMR